MDDQSLHARPVCEKNVYLKRGLSFFAALRFPSKNCINLSFYVFVLVSSTVNVLAQGERQNLTANALVNETLRYRMLTGALEIGQLTVNITNEDSGDFVHVVESVSGLLERTTTLLLKKDSTLSSHTSHTVITKSNITQEIQLQYDSRQVRGAVRRADRFEGTQEISATFATKTQDYYIVPYFFRSCVLQESKVIKFPVYEAVRHRVELARGWVVKQEETEVPLGKFTCYRLEGYTGKLRWVLFFDKQFPHRLIKQQFPALYIEAELVEIIPDVETMSRAKLGSVLQH